MAKSYAVCSACGQVNRYDVAHAETAKCGACRQLLPVDGPVAELDARGLQRLIDSSPLPVVVDFWAPWCAPCQAFAPTFTAAAQANLEKVVFAKVNTEANQAIGSSYGIRGIPTMLFFSGGRERARRSGALDGRALGAWLQEATHA